MRTRTMSSAHESEQQWNEDDLIERLCRALDFAEEAVRQLVTEEPDAGSLAELSVELEPEKLIAETAVLLLAASNVSSYAAVGPRVLRVASLLVPYARSARMLRRICLEPAAAFDHAKAHICLKRLGYYDPDFDAMLDLSAGAQAHDGRERAPHRMLEQDWLRQGWLYPEGMSRMRCNAHVANSVLSRPVDLLHGSREDIAAFADGMMYLRDFNLFPRPLPRGRDCILAEAECMLARCLDLEEYELASRVLLAWPLTGESWSPAAAFVFRVLARADGSAPHRSLLPSAPVATKGRARRSPHGGLLATAYPAVYATGLLCAATLHDRRMPPVAIPSASSRPGALEEVMHGLPPDGRRLPWQEELEELETAEREALAGFFLTMALHRELRRQGFPAMQNLLTLGASLGLAASPMATQSAELLGRVHLFESCVIESPLPQKAGGEEVVCV